MKSLRVLPLLLIVAVSSSACAQQPDPRLVGEALSAAPEAFRDAATIYAFNDAGTLEVIREGDGSFFCAADNPHVEGFEATCWQQALDAYVRRGYELKSEGIPGRETVGMREAEIDAGTLEWFDGEATMYLRYGENAHWDAELGEVVDSKLRYVVYTPYATSESTGLPLEPMTPGGPWIMNPGSFRAHIMLLPPN